MRTCRYFFLIIICFICLSCAAAQIALEKKDLKVETKMSDTIFLDIETQVERTIFVDIRNTSDKDIDIKSLLVSRLQSKGYTVTATPQEAFYILQGNVLYVGKADPSAIRESLYAGYGGALAGATAGAMIGGATGGYKGVGYGAGIGGLLGGAAELISGSLVKDITYTVITDLMISEKSPEQVEQIIQSDLQKGKGTTLQQTSKTTVNRKRYQTRIASTANKVNLAIEEALGPIIEGLSKSVAGIF